MEDSCAGIFPSAERVREALEIGRFSLCCRPMRCLFFLGLLLLTGCTSAQQTLYDVGRNAERRGAGLDAQAVDTPLGEVAYLEREAPGPTVVLLHGFGANKDNWLRFAPHLPDSLHVVALDMLGHGESAYHPDSTYGVPRLVDGVRAAVDALGITRFHLAGNSLGGLVATRLALAAPERVASLFLLDPAGVEPPEPSPYREALADGENPLIPQTAAGYDSLMALAFNDPPDLPWPAGDVLARQYAERAPINRQIWRDINDPPLIVTDELPDLSVPAFLLFGADDRIIDPSSAEVWAEQVPDLRVVLLPDVGHAPMLEAPRTTARYYLDFLRRVTP
jgi:pimeloyl-ACP methyl ester carboxylesterase